MLDEMYILKQLFWDQKNYRYAGYPTYGSANGANGANSADKTKGNETENSTKNTKRISNTTNNTAKSNDKNTEQTEKTKCPLATRALVFMLSGINKSFEFPVGYHFVNGLGADGLTEVVKEVIMKVSACGVTIANLTFDGAKENIKMCQNLGAKLDPLNYLETLQI